MPFSVFLWIILFATYTCVMAVCSGGSSGMEVYDVSETRNADSYLVIILLNFCVLCYT